ncbi:MAG: hypothetical protein J0L84_02000 [Verrucomicrobia bacterium]|nr:hypothetical protein [Verrucomicrobiota bacterium]
MDDPRAAENLQVIRTLMERAALYRRALAPVSLAAGVLGVLAAVLGWSAGLDSARGFAGFWLAVAAVTLAVCLLIMRRQALQADEPFWSPPARRVAQATLPALSAGLLAGGIVLLGNARDPLAVWWLPGAWMVLYGCASHAAGFFMDRGIKLFGALFIGLGALLLLCVATRPDAAGLPPLRMAHVVMGAAFGGLHLAYGAYLRGTERGTPPA